MAKTTEVRMTFREAFEMAEAKRVAGQIEVAEQIARQLQAAQPEDADVYHLLGLVRLDLHDLDGAVACFRRAAELAPERVDLRDAVTAVQQALAESDSAPQTGSAEGEPADVDGWVAEAERLAAADDAAGAAAAYQRAVDLAPDRGDLHYFLGSALDHAGRPVAASEAYHRALQRDPHDLYAKWRLQLLNMRQVARWHFPMLHDDDRHVTYDQAIRAAVDPGMLVLDIGTGSGLLAMMAARAGAEHVYACEVVALLADVARRVIARNGLSDRITVINKKSTELTIGVDLPRRADLLVSELISAGLLGEGHYPSIQHAAEELLVPDAPQIPCYAQVIAMLVESPELVALERVDSVTGFDLRDFNRLALPSYVPRRLSQHTYRPLTDQFESFAFDLTSRSLSDQQLRHDLVVTRDGTAHAIAYWFDMTLYGDVHMNTGPQQETSHWVQAVQLLDPRPVEAGQRVELVARHNTVHIIYSWD